MKHLIVALSILCISATILPAQETAASPNPTLEGFMQRTERTQAVLLENTREILQRLNGAVTIGVDGQPIDTSAFEARIKALEDKLAAAPQGAPAAAGAAPAAEEIESLQTNINSVWIVVTGAMVFFMQAGFCMLELGLTKAKNAINICMKNFLDFCVGAVCFLFLGFGLMFGGTQNGFIGTGPFWISDTDGGSSIWAFWFFQMVFCGTAATIVSGAMAERTKFVGYLFFTAALTGVVYPVIGHWAWGSFGGGFGYGGGKGWLEAMGYADFAGSSVVHGIGGAASLAGIIVVGARHGRFREDGSATLIAGHNLPMAALGTFILWFGWYGFNSGSTLVGDPSIGRIAVNTTLAPAAGALAAMFAMWLFQGKPDLGMTLNGALGGLVGITANCNCVVPASAVVIGLVSGIIASFGALLLEKFRLDDAVGAVPVHLFCGWWGILAVAIFNEAGFSLDSLGVQALGVASITGAAFFGAFIVFVFIDKVIGLRATDEEQDLGLDFTEHSGAAYPDFMTGGDQ